MGRLVRTLLFGLIACAVGAAAAWSLLRPERKQLPDGPLVVERIREVAKLETLEATLYEVVRFKVDPKERSSVVGVVFEWAKDSYFPDEATAVVFATAHLGFDLSQLDPQHVYVHGDQVDVVLPPLQSTVELKPDQTLVLQSTLDSQQTMQLLDLAKGRFETKVVNDAALRERAQRSSERAIKALLITMGFQRINFVEKLPTQLSPG